MFSFLDLDNVDKYIFRGNEVLDEKMTYTSVPRCCNLSHGELITSPPEGVARYCFHPVCLSVCVCVCLCICVSGQYFGILFLGY